MKTVYYAYLQGDNIGEAYGFFKLPTSNKLHMLHAFDCNDAMYRAEYMDPLFEALGISMKRLPSKYEKEAIGLYEEYIGA